MNHAFAATLALVLLGAASPSSSLVAGSVRDQHGVPIEGARVDIRQGPVIVGTAVTAADGTFVFDGAGSEATVTCRYCRPLRIPIGSDGIATAVVTRYDALLSDDPSQADLRALPYASPSLLLELVPFVVVNESARTIPGLSATDRNATPYGGLLVLDGSPDYDITANTTPFDTVPQGDVARFHVLRVDQAYRYGGLAQGGTFVADTSGGSAHLATGSDSLARLSLDGERARIAAAYSNASVGARAQRAAGALDVTTPGTVSNVTLSSGSGYASPNAASALFSSFSSLAAQTHTRGRFDSYAKIVADRGTYDYTSSRFPNSSRWSDTELEAGATSHASVAPFVSFDARNGSGAYVSAATGTDPIAGSLTEARAVAGVSHTSEHFDVLLAAGTASVGYAGVVGPSVRDAQTATDAVGSVTYRPADRWSFHASSSSGYTLQTFLGVYVPASLGYPYASPVIHGNTNESTVEFSDTSRVKIAATALSWRGVNGAATSSAGASIGWQIAPALSLRTWVLHESSTSWAPANVGMAWLSYANGDAFRVDAIWARSLLDRSPKNHLEGAISGRLTDRVDWFASSTDLRGSASVAVGLRMH